VLLPDAVFPVRGQLANGPCPQSWQQFLVPIVVFCKLIFIAVCSEDSAFDQIDTGERFGSESDRDGVRATWIGVQVSFHIVSFCETYQV
jgi:hypothetical protein